MLVVVLVVMVLVVMVLGVGLVDVATAQVDWTMFKQMQISVYAA